ncbi:MAG: acylneuraminate cytidylyltransferase family protein [Magnetococcales bacterium]|nr:acylneuraminate cytidylyltransferase family protein [Magnetococcales bacterium]
MDPRKAVGLIPARGGSKSIPLKNMVPLLGRPMIDYVIEAGLACPALAEVACSTDHEGIADHCRSRGVTVIPRPEALAGDDAPVAAVMVQVLEWFAQRDGVAPGMLALLQPTSPMILPEHIAACVQRLLEDPEAGSAQTIAPVLHNAHAYNQRLFEGGRVAFRFAEERKAAYNKQKKPSFYQFGNLVVTRATALLAGEGPFAAPSLGAPVERRFALDVDGPDDLAFAEFLLAGIAC